MEGYTKMPLGHLYWLIALGATAVFAHTLEVMIQVKNPDFYGMWLASLPLADQGFATVQLYTATRLLQYFLVVIIPMLFTVYTYFTYQKLRLNKLYVFIWTVLLAGSLGYGVVGRSFQDPWFYIYVALYGALIVKVLTLVDVMQVVKSK